MKPINVVCALILDPSGNILACQRSLITSHPGKWELPGGKIEQNETPTNAIIREIKEELDTDIHISATLPTVNHTYPAPGPSIKLTPFLCKINNKDTPKAIIHSKILWIEPTQVHILDWAEADIPIIQQYIKSTQQE